MRNHHCQWNSRLQTMLATPHCYQGGCVCERNNSDVEYVSSIPIVLTGAPALLTLSKLSSSGFGSLIGQMRVIAKVPCRSKILIFVTSRRSHHILRQHWSPCLPVAGPWLWVSHGECRPAIWSRAHFPQTRASPSLLKIKTEASYFLPLPPQILNRHHIILCWDWLIMYCCSAPGQTAAVFHHKNSCLLAGTHRTVFGSCTLIQC